MKTPNVQRIVDAVEAEFGSRVSTGEWLCRHIAGTLKWSQHSWTENPEVGVIYAGNAADIFPDNMAVGDQVQAFIKRNFPDLVAHLLWRVKNHFDHVHVDTWPQGYGLPPCRGGTLRVQYADGSIGRTFYQEEDLPLNDDDKAWISGEITRQLASVTKAVNQVPSKTWAHGDKADDPDDASAWQYLIRTKGNTDKIIDELT